MTSSEGMTYGDLTNWLDELYEKGWGLRIEGDQMCLTREEEVAPNVTVWHGKFGTKHRGNFARSLRNLYELAAEKV